MNLEGFNGNVIPPGIVTANEGQEWANAEKYMLLWRAVRLDEKQVNAEIKELVHLNGLLPTEIASRKEQLPPLRAKLAQIHKRLEWLGSDVDVWVSHAAEHRYVIEEMANSRLGAVAIDEDDVIQAAEINDANETIDALIAVKIFRLAPVERQATTASPAPLMIEGTPKGAEPAEAVTPCNAPVNTSTGPIVSEAASGDTKPDQTEPSPLTTAEIAFCFAGLNDKTEEEWKILLGKNRKWVDECLDEAGARGRGGAPKRWNPVLLGAALAHQGRARTNSVRAKFQTNHLLKPWLDKWKTYEADNFNNI